MDLVERLSRTAPAACDGLGIDVLYLFGSRARGDARPDSDIDIAVLLSPSADVDTLEVSLRVAGRLEDLARPGASVEAAVVLDEAPLPLAGRVLRDRVVLFSRDESHRVEYEVATMMRFLDFDVMDRRFARERLAAIAAD